MSEHLVTVDEVLSWDRSQVSCYLAVMKGLWDEVFDELRGVTFELKDKHVFVKCYVDGILSDDNKESLECMLTEVIADFTTGYTFDMDIERVDAPGAIQPLTAWVYLRKEQN